MSMTNDESQEINRRVAVALELKPWRGGICKRRLLSMPGYASCFPLPDFCRDPAAADLVREEIECRGWEWWLYRYMNEYKCDVQMRGDAPGDIVIWEVSQSSDDSPHMALCRAFLAACEAKAEEGGEE